MESSTILNPAEVHLLGKLLCPTISEALNMGKVTDESEEMHKLLDRLAQLVSHHLGQGMSASITIKTYTGLPDTPPKREPCWATLGNVPPKSRVRLTNEEGLFNGYEGVVEGHNKVSGVTEVSYYRPSSSRYTQAIFSAMTCYVTEWADA